MHLCCGLRLLLCSSLCVVILQENAEGFTLSVCLCSRVFGVLILLSAVFGDNWALGTYDDNDERWRWRDDNVSTQHKLSYWTVERVFNIYVSCLDRCQTVLINYVCPIWWRSPDLVHNVLQFIYSLRIEWFVRMVIKFSFRYCCCSNLWMRWKKKKSRIKYKCMRDSCMELLGRW